MVVNVYSMIEYGSEHDIRLNFQWEQYAIEGTSYLHMNSKVENYLIISLHVSGPDSSKLFFILDPERETKYKNTERRRDISDLIIREAVTTKSKEQRNIFKGLAKDNRGSWGVIFRIEVCERSFFIGRLLSLYDRFFEARLRIIRSRAFELHF